MVKPGSPLETWTSTETGWPTAPVKVAAEMEASMPKNGRPDVQRRVHLRGLGIGVRDGRRRLEGADQTSGRVGK